MKILITYPESFLSINLIKVLTSKYKLITDDIDYLNLSKTNKIIRNAKPDLIILNSPFSGGIKLNIEKPADLILKNIIAQTNIISSALENNIRSLFFVGSSCMYPKTYSKKLSENDLLSNPLEETNLGYAISKICGWQTCKSISIQYKKNYITLIPSNLYGEYDDFNSETAHVIGSLLLRFHNAKIKNDKEVIVWGTGKPIRDFIFAEDFANAVLSLIPKLSKKKMGFFEINIGSGEGNSIKEIAETVKKVVGFKGNLIFDKTKPDGMPVKVLNTEKINILKWQPKINLEKGISRTYKYFISEFLKRPFNPKTAIGF